MNALKKPLLAILGGVLLLLTSCAGPGSPSYGPYAYDDAYYYTYPYPYSYGQPYYGGHWSEDGYWWHGDHWAHGTPHATHEKAHGDHAHKSQAHGGDHDSGSRAGEHT